MRSLLFVFLSIVLFSCYPDKNEVRGPVDAYVPVYSNMEDLQNIKVENKKPTLRAGKIYAYERYLFQNELFEGIHIIDNRDKNQPAKVAFLKLPLSTEIAIRGNYLYSNNYLDLVVFDISDPAKPFLVNRVKDVFPVAVDQKYPPVRNAYFECADPSKGIVIRWEKKNIPVPDCRR